MAGVSRENAFYPEILTFLAYIIGNDRKTEQQTLLPTSVKWTVTLLVQMVQIKIE